MAQGFGRKGFGLPMFFPVNPHIHPKLVVQVAEYPHCPFCSAVSGAQDHNSTCPPASEALYVYLVRHAESNNNSVDPREGSGSQ